MNFMRIVITIFAAASIGFVIALGIVSWHTHKWDGTLTGNLYLIIYTIAICFIPHLCRVLYAMWSDEPYRGG